MKRLVPVWSTSLSSNYGEQGQPLVYDGVMFVANAEHTIAIDVATGRQIWRTPVNYDRGALRVASAGAIMRGAATICRVDSVHRQGWIRMAVLPGWLGRMGGYRVSESRSNSTPYTVEPRHKVRLD